MLATGNKIGEGYLQAIIKANHVYETLGFSIWPWEIDEAIPSDWMDAIEAFAYKLPATIQSRQERARKLTQRK